MRLIKNKSKLLLSILILFIITYSLSLFGKDDEASKSENKKVIFSESKESIVSYKNFENYHEQNVSRITFTELIDEVNVKSSSDKGHIL